jgi:UDP-N-acetylglucosamine 3-dehydrogenase
MEYYIVDTKRIAVIGTGQMGKLFIRLISEHPACQLAGVVDVIEEKTRAAGQELGVPYFSNHKTLFSSIDLDAVVIATSEQHHLQPTLDAAANGVHVLIEKPLADTSAAAKEMVAATRDAGTILMVGHSVRFDPHYQEAYRSVHNGEVGDVVHLAARRNTSVGDANRLQGRVSITMYLGSHSVDIVQWVIGSPIIEVTATGVRKAMTALDVDDAVLSLLRFENGAIGTLENSWLRPNGAASRKVGSSLIIMGTKGTTSVETMTPGGCVNYQENVYTPFNAPWNFATDLTGFTNNVYSSEFAHFVDCIKTGNQPIITPAQALSAVLVCEAIEESIRLRRPIKVVQDNPFS